MPYICLLLCLLPLIAQADYSDHPRATELAQELGATGLYSADEVLGILRQAEKNPKLIQNERKAPEKTKTWPEYRQIFMDASRIRNGTKFMREHYPALSQATQNYGVPAHVITAILGVETRYGGYTGPHRVIDSLATQGFDHPTRSAFFYSELKHYLMMCREMNLDPLAQKGSYAGAMGLSQFMPSNYRKLAVDFDRNGSVNLWTPTDAIGSTAHYLREYPRQISKLGPGWLPGEAVAFPVSLRAKADLLTNQKQPSYRWAEIAPHIESLDISLSDDQVLGLIELQTEGDPEYWLALPNFYAIFSYNPRPYYAMAVFQLSQALLRASLDERN